MNCCENYKSVLKRADLAVTELHRTYVYDSTANSSLQQ